MKSGYSHGASEQRLMRFLVREAKLWGLRLSLDFWCSRFFKGSTNRSLGLISPWSCCPSRALAKAHESIGGDSGHGESGRLRPLLEVIPHGSRWSSLGRGGSAGQHWQT